MGGPLATGVVTAASGFSAGARSRAGPIAGRMSAGWRRVKLCDVGIDAHRSTGSQSVAVRQPAEPEKRFLT
jgi:hypothetical protein